jgi:hypothetical protein
VRSPRRVRRSILGRKGPGLGHWQARKLGRSSETGNDKQLSLDRGNCLSGHRHAHVFDVDPRMAWQARDSRHHDQCNRTIAENGSGALARIGDFSFCCCGDPGKTRFDSSKRDHSGDFVGSVSGWCSDGFSKSGCLRGATSVAIVDRHIIAMAESFEVEEG